MSFLVRVICPDNHGDKTLFFYFYFSLSIYLLGHDFLFDSGLQFRTMNGGRKQYIADQYWDSVLHELEHALDKYKQHNHNKRTRPPTPPPWSEKYYSAYLHAGIDPQAVDSPIHSTVSSPASVRRVPALLCTLTEVLSYVIGSVSSERSLSLSQVLSGIDILFIDHELRHGLYEPAGLFTLMGQLLKAHCAPMRDGKVDVMVAVAKGDLNPSGLFGPPFSTSEFLPFTDGQRSIRRTVASLRLCFEILELMKLVTFSILSPYIALYQTAYLSGYCQPSLTSSQTIPYHPWSRFSPPRFYRQSSTRTHDSRQCSKIFQPCVRQYYVIPTTGK